MRGITFTAGVALGSIVAGWLFRRHHSRQPVVGVSDRPIVMLFGDSITQFSFDPSAIGWGAAISNWYGRCADVLNRGYSGYNTQLGSMLLKRLLPLSGKQPSLAVIFFGANDAAAPGSKQHVPVPQFVGYTMDIISQFRKNSPDTRIILVTPPPVDQFMDRSLERVRGYAMAIREICKQQRVTCLDLWGPTGIDPETDLFDGLHFGQGGNEKMAKKLMALIRSEFQDLCPDYDDTSRAPKHMSLHFPRWDNAVENPKLVEEWTWTQQ